MPRMEVDDYMNQQESLESSTSTKCLRCKKRLEDGEEYLCDSCFTKAMKEDMKAQAKDYEEANDWNEDWRFTDSRGRSIFKRE